MRALPDAEWAAPQGTDAFDAYANGAADAIVTAVKNTIFGSINEVYQLIESCGTPIIGEMKLAIDQMLITRPGAKLTGITEVYSHPVALAQCQSFLKQHMPHATLIEFFDTAGAVEFIASGHALHRAAIATFILIYLLPLLCWLGHI